MSFGPALGLTLLAAPLLDLRVGEGAEAARIEVHCAGRCAGEIVGGGVRLSGVTGDLDVPLEGPRLRQLSLTPTPTGALLSFDAAPASRTLGACGPRIVCVDLLFAGGGTPDAEDPVLGEPVSEAPRAQDTSPSPPALSPLRAKTVPLGERLTRATGDSLTEAACAAAHARLAEDAWALGAYRRAALCAATKGDRSVAAARLERLLTVEDDPAARRALAVLSAAGGGGGH